MFGFIVGTLSLVGLYKMYRWNRWGRHGGGRRWMMRRLFEHLDTTPGQEKVIAEAIDDVQRKAWSMRNTVFTSRADFAKAMRGEHFDGAVVSEAFERQQTAVEEMKKSVREALTKVHEALNPEQRNRLGDLIEYGPRSALHGGCGSRHFGHRHHHHHHGAGPHGAPVSL